MEILMNDALGSILPESVSLIWQDIVGWNQQKWENVRFSIFIVICLIKYYLFSVHQ